MVADNTVSNVLVTRPVAQADNLCQLLEQHNCRPIRFPTLQIVGFDKIAVRQQLRQLNKYHWLIFISVNAVNFALRANDGKIEAFKHCSIAAVGKATEKALKIAGLKVDLIPEAVYTTEGLLATSEMHNITNKSCLIVRGRRGREILAEGLRARDAEVEYMEVYARERPKFIDTAVIQLIKQDQLNAITITSGEALTNMLAMIDTKNHANLYLVPIIVISKRLKKLAVKMGFEHIIVATSPDDSAIAEAVLASLGSTN